MKRYRVLFLAPALDDLYELYRYIARKSSRETADGYLARLETFCKSLRTLPQRGTAVPGRVAGLRRMGFERRACILFRVAEDRVEILRILYGGQDLEPVLESILTS